MTATDQQPQQVSDDHAALVEAAQLRIANQRIKRAGKLRRTKA
jgi:hypothetical protein